MATKVYTIERIARQRLNEITPRFWSSDELTSIIVAGIKDLWRDIVNLDEDHFYTIDETNVSLEADSDSLTGVPADVHRIALIEPLDSSEDSSNFGLEFKPLRFNHRTFQVARQLDNQDPSNTVVYYSITNAGSPVAAPTIRVAPKVTSDVDLRFVYVPTISATLSSASTVPIPGDCDNALVSWTLAYARAKERDDQSPDPAWLATYKGEKDRLINSLGVRQTQEPLLVDPIFEEYY